MVDWGLLFRRGGRRWTTLLKRFPFKEDIYSRVLEMGYKNYMSAHMTVSIRLVLIK